MKKILLYVSEMTFSGAPNSTLRLARALSTLNYKVETWSYQDGIFRSEYDKYGIPVKIVNKENLRDKVIIKEVKKFDLLIANSILTYEAFEGISSIIPAYWYIREAENIPYFFRYDYKRGYVLKNCKNIIAVSEYAANYIQTYFNPDVAVLHNCVDDLYTSCSKIKSKSNKVKIIMIGTIERRKNFALLIDAFLTLPLHIREKMEIHLVGRTLGFEKSYGNYVISKSESTTNIFYHGEISDRKSLMELISEMDVLSVISNDESCSLAALEGAMMAKPLLLSENVGAKYLVGSGNGWIIKTDDLEAVRDALVDIFINKDQLPEMGQASRNHYLQTSTFDRYCSNVSEMMEKNKFHKLLYRVKNFSNFLKWYYDDTTKYYGFPDWGNTDEKNGLYSFDIFDTIITRDVATPAGIFTLMQLRLYEDKRFEGISEYVKENFIDLRVGAEGLARQVNCVNGVEDKTLDEIYEAFAVCGRISQNDVNKIKELEIEEEFAHSIGIEENIVKIKNLIDEGKRVVLVSDMYLSSDVIRNMLVKADPVFKKIKIYVSSECRLMKGSANLFKYVQEKEKVSFSNWSHFGDNINADVNAPSKMGIQCTQYSGVNLFDIEQKILNSNERDYFVQQNIGLTKLLLSRGVISNKSYSSVIDAMHLIVPYIYDCIQYLKRMKCKVAYCTNEFGKLLYLFGKGMFASNDMELEYICCLEIFQGEGKKDNNLINKLRYLLCNGIISLEELCCQLHISKDVLRGYSDKVKVDLIELDKPNFLFQLLSDKKFIDLICDKVNTVIQKGKCAFIDFQPANYYVNCIKEIYQVNYVPAYYFTANSRSGTHKNDCNIFLNLSLKEANICENLINHVLLELSKDMNTGRMVQESLCNACYELVEQRNRGTNKSLMKQYIKFLSEKNMQTEYLYPEDKYVMMSLSLKDCILTSTFATRTGILEEIKSRLRDRNCPYKFMDSFINSFVFLRMEAEEQTISAFREKKNTTKDLKDVYGLLCKNENISKRQQEYLINLEYDIVRKNVVGVQENIYRIHRAVGRNQKIVVIADTVYAAEFIINLLCDMDPVFHKVSFFLTSSADEYYYNSKDFFEKILKKTGINKSGWYHIGNSVQFDINGSDAVGMQKESYKKGDFLPYETAALYEFEKNLFVQTMIGTARNNRLIYRGKKEQIIGNSLAGAMLYPYVQWILDDTIARGINMLLFVARDGYILKQIADLIIKNQDLNIATKYVYGSRSAWRMPSYSQDEELDIFFKMAHIDQFSDVKAFSKIFKISFEELCPFLPERYRDPDLILKKDDYAKIRESLELNKNFKKYMEDKAATERKKIIKYFENICQKEKFSFVELSGTGSTQNCIGKILKEITPDLIITYFLNLDGLEHRDNMLFLNYAPNNFFYSWVIENLCRAPHGQVDGYEDMGNEIIPVLSETCESDALIKHGYLDYTYGIIQFAQEFSKCSNHNCLQQPVLFQKYLRHIMYNPCDDIKDFIGDMPFEATGFGTEVTSFAPKLTESQMRDIYLTKRDDESIDSFYKGACIDFSLKRMSKEEIKTIEFYKQSKATKYGRQARMKRRMKEDGLMSAISFMYKRYIREIMLKLKIIRY